MGNTNRTYVAGVLEALERFNEAARAEALAMELGTSLEQVIAAEAKFKEAKETMLDLLSQIY